VQAPHRDSFRLIQANADTLKGVMKWLGREEWRQPYSELLERHLGPPRERAGIAFDELADKIGREHAGILYGWMFEDSWHSSSTTTATSSTTT